MKYVLLLLALIILFACEDASMTFPVLETTGSIEISVHPFHVERTITLADTTKTVIREYHLQTGDSTIIATQLPYGYYDITASAETYYTYEHTFTMNRQFDRERIDLSQTPHQIRKISPTPGIISSLDPYASPGFTDSTAIICINFYGPVDTVDLKSKITLTPLIDCDLTFSKEPYYDTKCYIAIPLDLFFQTPTLQISLDSTILFEETAQLKENYTCSYTIDTSLADAAINSMYIRKSNPSINQWGFEPTDTCYITFRKNVDKASVEKAFSITPVALPSFWWGYENGYNTLYFTIAQGLQAKSDYTVTLDTTMRFLNGASLRSPYKIPFQTVDFYLKGTSPANGELIEHYYYQDMIFNFSVEIDSASFMNAYSISPAETHTSVLYTGKSIRVIYSWGLEDNTKYTVTVDSTLTDKYGTTYGREIQATFRVTD